MVMAWCWMSFTSCRRAARLFAAVAAVAASCSTPTTTTTTTDPLLPPPTGDAAALWTKAQHVFDTRCVVCHGCFDAPCQLKLDSYEGITRGANPTTVYAARPLATSPTRLFVDAHDTAAWRAKGFHAVVPEAGTLDGVGRGVDSSVMLRLLALKREHPLTPDVDIEASFNLELGRKQVCTEAKDVDRYAKEHPLWGMPWGLPALDDDENDAIVSWVAAGMPHRDSAVSPALERQVAEWESFLNDDSLRGRLVSRYLFEHLYFASLYFPATAANAASDDATFFVMVRSTTPPGTAVNEVATRRPFDDPGVASVFYRLVHRERLPLDKTHMPYALGPARRAFIEKLFFGDDVVVTSLPGYEAHLAANPFRVFAALPVAARYRFLLEDAEFTLMGFVKGPVCRGNVALNVINDRFWVAFVDPDSAWMTTQARLLTEHAELLDLPAEGGSNAPWLQWLQYADHQKHYLKLKAGALPQAGAVVDADVIWNGDGKNDNAALTVFRHYDHGSVVKGFVGADPDSAFVIDYSVLERISYLLISGFDVFGSVSHQMQTRMYMDFLRMEAEANFLAFQEPRRRTPLIRRWYRDLSAAKQDAVDAFFAADSIGATVAAAPVAEDALAPCASPECSADYGAIKRRTAAVASRRFGLARAEEGAVRDALRRINGVRGTHASQMPELSFVEVTRDKEPSVWLTIMRNSAHTNVASMFDEEKRLLPGEDSLTAVPGLLGAYPSAFFVVARSDLGVFAAAVDDVNGATAWGALRKRWGVLRNDPGFWAFSDRLHAAARALDPLGSGTLDFGRLDPL